MVTGRRLTNPKRCSTAATIKSRMSSPLTPRVVARKLMASRSQQSSAKATRTRSPLSQPISKPSEHQRRLRSSTAMRPSCRRSTPPAWRSSSRPWTFITRDHRANPRDRHQAPAHIIVADDGQQAAMQDAELLANDPPDNEQWFHQLGQIGKVLDKLLDARLELHRPHHAHLEAEVAQGGTQVVLNGNGLRLKQLAMGQQHPKLLAA